MKKFLSLVLSLVMTMSLVTVSAGAKEFKDDDTINYDEAVSVISAVGIVDGYTDGSFRPQADLTRGAAAKIISNLILGPTNIGILSASDAPYKDVPANSTFAPYIAFCQQQKIISGYADGTFRPSAKLTGYAFLKMLLGALGYDQNIQGYVGPNWRVQVAKDAKAIGLWDGLKNDFEGQNLITREEACLYSLNTLKSTLVAYDAKYVTAGNAVVATNNKAYPVTWTEGKNHENIKKDGFVQFAEQYFSDLSVKAGSDVFMRPTNEWSLKNEKIGSFVDYTQLVATYTTGVSGMELYDVSGKTAYKDYAYSSYVDGDATDLYKEISKNNKNNVTGSGNGALLEVFVNDDAKTVTITVINTYLAQANSDYNEKKDNIGLTIYLDPAKPDNAGYTVTDSTVSGEDFNFVVDMAKDDFALVTMTAADHEVQSVEAVEVVKDVEITKFKSGKNGNLTVGGETYSYAVKAAYDKAVLADYTTVGGSTNLKDLTYNVYLLTIGGETYAIGVDLVKTPDNYLFITGVDGSSSNRYNKTYDATAIFMDGTTKAITVKPTKTYTADFTSDVTTKGDTINSWHTYTVDNDGVYTIEKVEEATTSMPAGKKVAQYHAEAKTGNTGILVDNSTNEYEINYKRVDLPGQSSGTGAFARVYGNDATVYLTASIVNLDKTTAHSSANVVIIDEADDVTTGIKNTSLTVWDKATVKDKAPQANNSPATNADSNGVYTLYKDNGYIIATVVVGESAGVSDKIAYVHSDKISSESYDKANKVYTWTRNVIINGVEVELVESNSTGVSALKNMRKDTWIKVKYDAKDLVRDFDLIASPDLQTTVAGTVTQMNTAGSKWVVLDNAGANYKYNLIGGTLYDQTTGQMGFRIAEDVKIALYQKVKNKPEWTFETGVAALTGILENLNTVSNFDYYLDAFVENGMATSVIIRDMAADSEMDQPHGPVSAANYQVNRDNNGNIEVLYNGASTPHTFEDLLNILLNDFQNKGYTLKSMDMTTGKITFTNKLGEFVYNWDKDTTHEAIALTIDGTPVLAEGRMNLDAVVDANGSVIAKGTTGFAKDDVAALTNPKTLASTTVATVGAGANIVTGYVSVAAPTTSITGGTDGATAATLAVNGVTSNTYVKINTTLTATITTTANGAATKGSTVTLTVTGATAPAAQTITADEAKTGKTLTYTIKVGVANITAIGGTLADAN